MKGFITNARIFCNNSIYSIELLQSDGNNEIIDSLNKRLRFYDDLYVGNLENIKIVNNEAFCNKLSALKNNFNLELSNKENEIEVLQQKLINKTKTIEESVNFKLKAEFTDLLHKKDIEIINLQNKLNHNISVSEINNTIEKYFSKFNSTSTKALIGENKIYSDLKEILRLYDNYILENVSGKSNCGDLYLEYKNLKCCIEVKNHSNPIKKDQIDRFIYTDIEHPNYNCGIFISIQSDFTNSCKIKHFDIKNINNKPCIFITNYSNCNSDILFYSINILNYLLLNNINNEKYDKVETLRQTINSISDMEKINNQQIKATRELKTIIKNEKNRLTETIQNLAG